MARNMTNAVVLSAGLSGCYGANPSLNNVTDGRINGDVTDMGPSAQPDLGLPEGCEVVEVEAICRQVGARAMMGPDHNCCPSGYEEVAECEDTKDCHCCVPTGSLGKADMTTDEAPDTGGSAPDAGATQAEAGSPTPDAATPGEDAQVVHLRDAGAPADARREADGSLPIPDRGLVDAANIEPDANRPVPDAAPVEPDAASLEPDASECGSNIVIPGGQSFVRCTDGGFLSFDAATDSAMPSDGALNDASPADAAVAVRDAVIDIAVVPADVPVVVPDSAQVDPDAAVISPEICMDGVDNDLDGRRDGSDLDCANEIVGRGTIQLVNGGRLIMQQGERTIFDGRIGGGAGEARDLEVTGSEGEARAWILAEGNGTFTLDGGEAEVWAPGLEPQGIPQGEGRVVHAGEEVQFNGQNWVTIEVRSQ